MANRLGKHNGGFRKGRLAAVLAGALALLCLTLFVTHQVYTRFFAPPQPESLTAGRDILTAGPAAQSGQSATEPAPTTKPVPATEPALATSRPPATQPGEEETDGAETDGAETDGEEADGAETPAPVMGDAPPDSGQAESEVEPTLPTQGDHGLYSRAALLIELDSGAELFALDADVLVYPASLVKIMTALVALDHAPNLDAPVTVTADMLAGLSAAGAAVAGFLEGETVPVRDLLYGLMLPSGADAANALAVHTAGSVEDFVALMNTTAFEIGMQSTHFANPHGLHDTQIYTTCRDLSLLLGTALQNADFRQIFTTGVYTTAPTPEHPKGITLRNAIAAAFGERPLENGTILGSKTGFTTPAGQCLASLASIGGREYILITTGAGRAGYNTARYNLLDALELYGRIGG